MRREWVWSIGVLKQKTETCVPFSTQDTKWCGNRCRCGPRAWMNRRKRFSDMKLHNGFHIDRRQRPETIERIILDS